MFKWWFKVSQKFTRFTWRPGCLRGTCPPRGWRASPSAWGGNLLVLGIIKSCVKELIHGSLSPECRLTTQERETNQEPWGLLSDKTLDFNYNSIVSVPVVIVHGAFDGVLRVRVAAPRAPGHAVAHVPVEHLECAPLSSLGSIQHLRHSAIKMFCSLQIIFPV